MINCVSSSGPFPESDLQFTLPSTDWAHRYLPVQPVTPYTHLSSSTSGKGGTVSVVGGCVAGVVGVVGDVGGVGIDVIVGGVGVGVVCVRDVVGVGVIVGVGGVGGVGPFQRGSSVKKFHPEMGETFLFDNQTSLQLRVCCCGN